MAIMHTVVCLLFLFIVNCKSQASFYTRGINVEALCEECDTTTGSGYVYHPKYCHLFVHCTIGQDKRLVGQVKECTRGLLWSQKVKQCVWPEESDCPTNPCFNQSLTLRDLRTCNGYFTCTDGLRLQFNCCDKNERFSEVDGRCYKDYTCNDACLPNSSNTTAKLLACDRFEYPDNKGKYLWSISGTNISMDCAAGTAFSAEMCSCTDNADFINIAFCDPYIYFPFDINIKDKMGKTASGGLNTWIRTSEPAAVGGGAVYFDGKRQVIAWAMNNMEFKSNFTLSFRFKADLVGPGGEERYALVDNSDCAKEATFGVALLKTSPKTGTIHGGFRLKNGEAVTTSSDELSLTSWHSVVLIKNGHKAELRVDNNIYPIMGYGLQSDIDRVDCSMTIGKGTGLENFVGYIDEVKFYKCVPDEFKN
ncbi:protein PIF [Patella vulgata]|uniref:protein PIF n=1 Tax=Patella vulgata TaxID=6465 RepID=UPI0024A9FA58|nr:protein PIF [Patella vulgata]